MLERKITHRKAIIGGKLYDTEKSQFLVAYKDESGELRILFRTTKGNYFSGIFEDGCFINENYGRVYEHTYYDLRTEDKYTAQKLIGLYNPDKYIELFGEVEDA